MSCRVLICMSDGWQTVIQEQMQLGLCVSSSNTLDQASSHGDLSGFCLCLMHCPLAKASCVLMPSKILKVGKDTTP